MRPLVTVAVPSFNQGEFLDQALASIFSQNVPVEVFVADGGSTDNSLDVIRRWAPRLLGWRSYPDSGQASAINEGIKHGAAPYVCWLNSDDWLLEGGLSRLLLALDGQPVATAMAYGKARDAVHATGYQRDAFVRPFDAHRMAVRCLISQPATLIRRSAWEAVGGVDESLHLALDYDLWWRLYKSFGRPLFVDSVVAVNREHGGTKTQSLRQQHYNEAIQVVRQHYGRVPLKWWVAQPYAVWFRGFTHWLESRVRRGS